MPTLKEIGERKIIHKLQKFISNQSGVEKIEDAYLHEFQSGSVVVNVDSMSRKADFLPGQTWEQIGCKLVTITLSDLAAKGTIPEIFLSSLVMEHDMDEKDFTQVLEGIKAGCDRYNCLYLGGDLGAASETVMTGCGIGTTLSGRIIKRHTALPGDIVCTTGTFGLPGYGLSILLEGKNGTGDTGSDELYEKAVDCLFNPVARLEEGYLLSKYNLATAAIDSSDGLALSLYWIAHQSKLKIVIDRLPMDSLINRSCFTSKLKRQWVLHGGEEYEIVFTVKPRDMEKLKEVFNEKKREFTVVGRCENGYGIYLAVNGHQEKIKPAGWDSFQ